MSLARRVAEDLDRLHEEPDDPVLARRLSEQLQASAADAERAGQVKKIFQIALGILAAIGGFVDIGDLVFNVQAGAKLGYQLLWVVVVGVVGIIVYSEMCGRVAAVSKRACLRCDP